MNLHSSGAINRKSEKQLLIVLMLRSKGVVREGFFEEMTFELGLDFEDQGRLFEAETEARYTSDHRIVLKERWMEAWLATFCVNSEIPWKFLTQER